jgi:hypothetical protein
LWSHCDACRAKVNSEATAYRSSADRSMLESPSGGGDRHCPAVSMAGVV